MIRRVLAVTAIAAAAIGVACAKSGNPSPNPEPSTAAPSLGVGSSESPERAIRRDIPMTNMIRRAFAEGSRDSTGRPGRKYWQLWMDYTINARLEQSTSTLAGRETIVLHNNSDSALSSIQMRLDQNIFRGDVPRGASVPAENTDGMRITKLVVDGAAVDMNPPPGFGRGGRGGRAGRADDALRDRSQDDVGAHSAAGADCRRRAPRGSKSNGTTSSPAVRDRGIA